MSSIAENLRDVQDRIARACERVSRKSNEVTLLAVSKTQPIDAVVAACNAGHFSFAENYVQEALKKFEALQAPAHGSSPTEKARPRFNGTPVAIHGIGHLQRNKVRHAVRLFEAIHTVDTAPLLREIAKEAQRIGTRQTILIQVNVSGEATKSGCDPKEVFSLAEEAAKTDGILLRGLMSIGEPLSEEASDSDRRREFVALRTVRDEVERSIGISLPDLSMGMSGDYELAVEEGATFVRVGSAIFGARV